MKISQIIERAITLQKKGKSHEAEKLYRKILKNEPNNENVNHNLGIILASRNDIVEALSLFRLSTIINPNIELFWLSYINALIKNKELENAKIISKKIIKIKPDFIKLHLMHGSILTKLGKLDQAELIYRKVIEVKPELFEAQLNLGAVLQDQKKLNEAELIYKKVIELKPELFEAHFNLVRTLHKLDKVEDAEAYCRKAIELRPNFPESYNILGTILQNNANFEDAELAYKKGIELKPNYIECIHNLKILLNFKKLLAKINETKKNKKNNKNKLDINTGLIDNFFISNRTVETELINSLYSISSKGLSDTKDVFYGNGRHSINFQLFEELSKNNHSIIKNVKEDLKNIMKQAVKSDIFIIDSFFNILNNGGGSVFHTHLTKFDEINNLVNQKYSLTYYLRVGDQKCSEPGILKLKNPDKEILPSEGMIMIFPANQKHSAFYNGKTDRVMIGVNFYSLI